MRPLLAVAAAALLCGAAVAAPSIPLPPGFPAPLMPAADPTDAAKVSLGKRLFFDPRLSVTNAYSCASCHRPELAFTDGLRTAVGATGEHHSRNTPSLYNVVYAASLGWADPLTKTLEAQHLIPMFNAHPIELGLNADNLPAHLTALDADPELAPLIARAYPSRANERRKGLELDQVTGAIAAFVRTLVAGDSAYDRYLYFDEPLDPAARRGVALFFSARMGCATCHGSFNFSGPVRHVDAPKTRAAFHNTGLYNLGGTGAVPDAGLAAFTHRARDTGAFRAPSLRNVAVTAPYMHDGSIATLGEVIDFYARGGRLTDAGPLAGDGKNSRYKRSEIHGFALSGTERADLIAFLQSLTERSLLGAPDAF